MVSAGLPGLVGGHSALQIQHKFASPHSARVARGGHGCVDLAGSSLLWLSAAAKSSDSFSSSSSSCGALVCFRICSNPRAAQELSWRGRSSRSLVRATGGDHEASVGEGKEPEARELRVTGSEQGTSASSPASGRNILTFLCPLLKLLGGGDPAAPRNVFLETATSGVASMARLPWGSKAIPEAAAARASKGQPLKLFQLYEFEACPFCRRVREALTELDLSAEVYPCPKGSVRHREFVRQVGGKDQFPFFVDPNTGATLYESSDIVKYLFKEYGEGKEPSPWLLESTLVTRWVPTLLRTGIGMMRYAQTNLEATEKKLELYSYETTSLPDW